MLLGTISLAQKSKCNLVAFKSPLLPSPLFTLFHHIPAHMPLAVIFNVCLLRATASLHALAETVLALSRIPYQCAPSTLSAIRNLVPRLEKARLYRGRGGEMVRGGACRLLECIALAEHAMTKRAQVWSPFHAHTQSCMCLFICLCIRPLYHSCELCHNSSLVCCIVSTYTGDR